MMKKSRDLLVESLLVDVTTAATLLNVCEKTIRNLTKRGELPVVRIAGRVLYSREDLTNFIRLKTKGGVGSENESAALGLE